MQRLLIALLFFVACAAVLVAVIATSDDSASSDAATTSDVAATVETQSLTTVAASLTDLVTTTEIDGTLGFGTPTALPNRAGGVLTWLPEPGTVVAPGDVLYEVDDLPVVYVAGELPAYRALRDGVDGNDGLQLETHLDALGYMAPVSATVDGDITSYTELAIEDWYEGEYGVTEQTDIPDGWIVFGDDSFRISSVTGALGSAVNAGSVLSVTGTTRVITVELDPALSGVLEEGLEVLVELPDESEVPATVTFVAGVVTTEGQGQQAVSWIDVELELAGSGSAFDESPVTIVVDEAIELDATVVPISALLALAEGGYAVEIVEGDDTALRAVTPVNFLGNDVSINGELEPGDLVVVP